MIWCIENASQQNVRLLQHIVRKVKELGDESETKLALLDAEFHLKIVEASGNRVLMRLMINLLDLLGENRARALIVPGRQKLSVLEHELIFEAIKQRDAELAHQRMLSHLANVREAMMTTKPNVVIYSKPECCLCDKPKTILLKVQLVQP